MPLSRTTQDHDEIQRWAEARGAVPAEVTSTEKNGETGILRFEFPKAKNANDSALNEISWDDFFEKFDASSLALVYQEKTAAGETSNFNKLVHPENAKPAKKSSKTTARKSATKKAPAKKTATKKTAAKAGTKTGTRTGTKPGRGKASKTAAKSSRKTARGR
jgi:hypothetical protein